MFYDDELRQNLQVFSLWKIVTLSPHVTAKTFTKKAKTVCDDSLIHIHVNYLPEGANETKIAISTTINVTPVLRACKFDSRVQKLRVRHITGSHPGGLPKRNPLSATFVTW